MNISEQPNITKKWTVSRFNSIEDYLADVVNSESIIEGNMLLNEGIGTLLLLLTGGTATAFNNANSYLGVGDSSTAELASQTGLQAVTNKLYKPMEATYPTIVGQTITFKAVFSGAEANFAWDEFTIANGNSNSAVNLNRKVSAQGTKIAGQVWTLSLGLTFG
jgi:hypothetical protein